MAIKSQTSQNMAINIIPQMLRCIYPLLDHCETLLSLQTSLFPSCPNSHWPNWRAEKKHTVELLDFHNI